MMQRLIFIAVLLGAGGQTGISQSNVVHQALLASLVSDGSSAGGLGQSGSVAATSAGCGGQQFSYNVMCFGADPTGNADSAAAIQHALDKAAGSPVLIPAGKYVLMRPLVIEAGNNSPGPRIEGAGMDVTYLEPCFVGRHPMPEPGGVIVVDGSRSKGTPYPYRFAHGGYIRGLTIDGNEARISHPGLNCPSVVTANLDGIEISSWWEAEIEDIRIENMGKDALEFPARGDLFDLPNCHNVDCLATAEMEIKHTRLLRNHGWGVDAEAGIGFANNGITESVIELNAAGGVYLFGSQNWIVNNAIASNGCSVSERPAGGKCDLSQPGGASSPQPGGGILIARSNPYPQVPNQFQSPYGGLIERNELDSNYGYDVWVQGGDNIQIVSNRFLNHSYSQFHQGSQGDYPPCQIVLGFGRPDSRYIVRNTYLRNNLSRSDPLRHDEADYATEMYCVEPDHVAQVDESLDMTFGTNTYNFSVLAGGGGATGICNVQGGSVTNCEVQVGGWFPANSTPDVKIVGPGCSGVSAEAQMNVPSGASWGWVSSIQVKNGGNGCTGAAWPIFGIIPYPKVNQLSNHFRGFNPPTATNSRGKYGEEFTRPQ